LSQLTDEAAVRLVARQDPEVRHAMGPGTPASLTEVLERSHAARTRGWAYVHDSFEEGISAMATAVLGVDGRSAVGVVSIAGPSLQLTNDRMNELAAPLKAAAVELSGLTGAIAADINSRRLNHDEAVTA
jgi:DNA-binding IclR family transcriptional regulator